MTLQAGASSLETFYDSTPRADPLPCHIPGSKKELCWLSEQLLSWSGEHLSSAEIFSEAGLMHEGLPLRAAEAYTVHFKHLVSWWVPRQRTVQ